MSDADPTRAPTDSRALPRLAAGLAAAFVALLLLLHLLEPEFDPSWRMISEYELGRFGWVMRLAFFCWGGSVLALAGSVWSLLQTTGGRLGKRWLLVIATALFGAGIFKTNAITDSTPGTAHTLHQLCGATVILTFPIAVSLISSGLARRPEWVSARRRLSLGQLLCWVGLVAFFGSMIVSRLINPAAGRVGPEVFIGWPNRLMVTAYAAWLIVVALQRARLPATR